MLRVLLQPMYVTVDHGSPVLVVGHLVLHVVFVRTCLLVSRQDEGQCSANLIKDVGTLAQSGYLVGGQGGVVNQRLGRTERRPTDTHILLAHVVDALLQVLLTDPRLVESPGGLEALTFTSGVERNRHVGLLVGRQVKAR